MRIDSFRHRGLQRLYRDDNAKGVPPAQVEQLRNMLATIETADNLDQIGRFPGWYPLKPKSKGRWSLVVTGNWRLAFHYSAKTNTVSDVDLEDYH